MEHPLSLSLALKQNRLEDFIRQQEAAGTGPAAETDVLEAIAKVAKSGKSAGQTSRSASAGGSTGK
jgi:hypothetical protein